MSGFHWTAMMCLPHYLKLWPHLIWMSGIITLYIWQEKQDSSHLILWVLVSYSLNRRLRQHRAPLLSGRWCGLHGAGSGTVTSQCRSSEPHSSQQRLHSPPRPSTTSPVEETAPMLYTKLTCGLVWYFSLQIDQTGSGLQYNMRSEVQRFFHWGHSIQFKLYCPLREISSAARNLKTY